MQDLGEITKRILEKNRARLNAMIDLIGSKEMIAFVGAGLSQPLGFPSWNNLLKQLREEARSIDKNSEFKPSVRLTSRTALQYADELQTFFRTHDPKLTVYSAFLGNAFKRHTAGKAFTDVQRMVVSLPFRTWVTTNYDVCLEDALECPADIVVVQKDGGNAHTVSDCLLSLHESQRQRPSVIHMHGVHSQTEQIILSATDYANAYGKQGLCQSCGNNLNHWTLHRKLAWALMATRRLVFFGFSLTDPYVLELLKTVATDLWRFNEPVHFAVVAIDAPIDSESDADKYEERFRKEYGIQLVFYDKENNEHDGLTRLLEQIHVACGDGIHIRPPAGNVFVKPVTPNAAIVDPATAKRVIEAANLQSDIETDKA